MLASSRLSTLSSVLGPWSKAQVWPAASVNLKPVSRDQAAFVCIILYGLLADVITRASSVSISASARVLGVFAAAAIAPVRPRGDCSDGNLSPVRGVGLRRRGWLKEFRPDVRGGHYERALARNKHALY